MKYCSQCGRQMLDEARYCEACGKAVINDTNSIHPGEFQVKTGAASVKANNKKTAIVILAVLGIILLIFCLLKDKDSPSGNDPLTSIVSSVKTSNSVSNTPEEVTLAYMQAVYHGDRKTAAPLCYREDQADILFGLAYAALTDLSSDHKIRHRPTRCRLVSKSSTSAHVNVYDEKNECFCTVELDNINGKWRVGYM